MVRAESDRLGGPRYLSRRAGQESDSDASLPIRRPVLPAQEIHAEAFPSLRPPTRLDAMREQRIIQPREGATYITRYFCAQYSLLEFPINLIQPSPGKKSIHRVRGAGEIQSKAEPSTMVRWSRPSARRG